METTSLSDWSKWITGISLFSASGCIGVLVTKGVGEKNIINIKLAIVFFIATIIVAWMVQLVLALKKTGVVLKVLIIAEIILFSASAFYLARWIWKFPAIPAAAKLVSEKQIAGKFTDLRRSDLRPLLVNQASPIAISIQSMIQITSLQEAYS